MTGLLTIIGAGITATIVSMLVGFGLNNFTENRAIHALKTLAIMGTTGVFVSGFGTTGFYIILLMPLIIGVGFGILYTLLRGPLARRGYLGNRRKWMMELDADDGPALASLRLLDDEQINEAATLSSNSDDFRDNLVRAAGLEDHEVPGLD